MRSLREVKYQFKKQPYGDDELAEKFEKIKQDCIFIMQFCCFFRVKKYQQEEEQAPPLPTDGSEIFA